MRTHTVASSTGSALIYDVWQAGPMWALLVHGLSSNAQTWWQVAERLAASGISTITVDQRSHGRSAVADGGYGWATLSDDLVTVLNDAGAGRVVVAGQSWGASVVLELAVRALSRVRGVVSVDGAQFALRTRFPSWEACRTALRPADIPPVPRSVMRGYVRDAHPTWSDAGIDGTLANFRELNGLMERALPIPHHMEIVRQLWDHDPISLYARLEQPATVLVASPTIDHLDLEAEVVAMPGDHDLHVEKPDAVADVLIDRSHQWPG